MVNTGLYGKSIERWNNLPAEDQNQQVEFRVFFISEYKHILIECEGPTNSQVGYGGMFNAMEGDYEE